MVDVVCLHCSEISKFDVNSLSVLYDRGQNPSLEFPQKAIFVRCKNCKEITNSEKIIIIHDLINKILLISIPVNIMDKEDYFHFINNTIIGIVDTTPPELRGMYLLDPIIVDNFGEYLNLDIHNNHD